MRTAYLITAALMVVFSADARAGDFAKGVPLYHHASTSMLLNDPRVHTELKTTKEQQLGIKECMNKLGQSMASDIEEYKKPAGPDRDAKICALLTKRGEEYFQLLGKVLKPEQVKRLKQIQLQQHGMNVFEYPEFREALKLTSEQHAKVKSTYDKMIKDLIMDAKNGRISQKEVQRIYSSWGRGVPDGVRAVLTEKQQKKVQELIGEPF
jgi:hypothetical protein